MGTTAAEDTLYGYLNSRTTSNKMAQTVNVNMKLPEIRRKRFKIVFLVHFILTAFAMMAWAPAGYCTVNLLFLGCFAWSLAQNTSTEPVSVALVINIFSIIYDCIILGLFFPRRDYFGNRLTGVSYWTIHSVVCS